MDKNSIIQMIEENCIIPSLALNNIAIVFRRDLNCALQLLGVKYDSMVKKLQDQVYELETLRQDQVYELETLRADCETLRSKCLEECKPQYEELKQKYTREYKERKSLHNELIELKGNIRVFCRCRPFSSDEISNGCTSVLEFNPSLETELQIICPGSLRKQFKFDHVFGPMDNQETVFAETLPIVNSVLDGYNVCIFAYGQTGTGKTFTMEGDPDNRGVNYRALEELFKSSKERSSMTKYDFSVSLLEVYNEKIRDLLAENSDQAAKKLEIKQAADGTQDVPGLVESLVCSTDEAWEMLKTGSRNRSVGSTNANEQSSRSHCLVRVTIKGEDLVNGQRSRSHLWLVDLAGSERAGKIGAERERLKESQFINKSLSALGDVISALAMKNPYIPYRNSKLTHLLQNSLGGDCKTLMFAQISPISADLETTLSSLTFASRLRGIEYEPARKQSDIKHIQMAEKFRQEKKENAKLSEMIRLMNLKLTSRQHLYSTLQEKVRYLENQLAEQRKPRHQDVEQRKPRPAFGRMSNRLPSSDAPSRVGSFVTRPGLEDKENMSMTGKEINRAPITPLTKARRISLTPVICSIPVQPKRQVTVAILPSELEKLSPLPETMEQYINNSGTSESDQLRDLMSLQGTPLRAIGVAATPDRRDKPSSSKFSSSLSQQRVAATPDRRDKPSSSKFSSSLSQQLWDSPIQRLPQVPSPGSSTHQMQNKLCFNVQKRLIVNSPGFKTRGGLNEASRAREVVRKLSTAERAFLKIGSEICR